MRDCPAQCGTVGQSASSRPWEKLPPLQAMLCKLVFSGSWPPTPQPADRLEWSCPIRGRGSGGSGGGLHLHPTLSGEGHCPELALLTPLSPPNSCSIELPSPCGGRMLPFGFNASQPSPPQWMVSFNAVFIILCFYNNYFSFPIHLSSR